MLTWTDVFRLITAAIAAAGNAAAIILAIVKWAGDFLSHRLIRA